MYSPERDSRGSFPAALPLKRTHGTRIMVLTTTSTSYVVSARGFRSARPTRRRHRAKRTRRGPIGATAAGRDPGREPIHILFDITTRPLGATPLRRAGPAAAGAVPGRWPLRGRESPQDRPRGRGAQCAFTASHECDHHRVTSLRTLVMRSGVILIVYTHISTTTAALGHLAPASAAHDQTDRPPREAATDGICDQPRP